MNHTKNSLSQNIPFINANVGSWTLTKGTLPFNNFYVSLRNYLSVGMQAWHFIFSSLWLYNLEDNDIIGSAVHHIFDENFFSCETLSEWEYENGNSKKTFHCWILDLWRMSKKSAQKKPISQLFLSAMGNGMRNICHQSKIYIAF